MLVSLSMRSTTDAGGVGDGDVARRAGRRERAARDRDVVDANQPSLERFAGAAVGELRQRHDLRRWRRAAEPAGVTLVTVQLGEAVELRHRADGFDVSPIPNGPTLSVLLKRSMPPVASWM